MDAVNQKIIDGVIRKAEMVCPDSLALIGVYGSAATGDTHEKSDLDLLILIEDSEGWKLSTGFILEDRQVGYDIYCTTWESLKEDARCGHAHLSKLLDSKIVYIKNQESYRIFRDLQDQARGFLASGQRLGRVETHLEQARLCYADAQLRDDLGPVRMAAAGVVTHLLDAVMLFQGDYFRLGTKRTFEELARLPLDEEFLRTLRQVAAAQEVSEIRSLLKKLILSAERHIRRDRAKRLPAGHLAGTYEEMFSNWHGKMEQAAGEDVYASFMNLAGLQCMLTEIAGDTDIGSFDLMGLFSPDYLGENVALFDVALDRYARVCRSAGIQVRRFADVDAFLADYLKEA